MNIETITMSRESDLQFLGFAATEAEVRALKIEGYSIIRYLGKAVLQEGHWYEAWVTDKDQFWQLLDRVRKEVENKNTAS